MNSFTRVTGRFLLFIDFGLAVLAISSLGTFLINLMRLSVIVWLFNFSRTIYAVVYHDYLAALVTTVWLFCFWWFAYRFVLEEK